MCIHIWGGDMCALLPAKFIKLFEPVEIIFFYFIEETTNSTVVWLPGFTGASGGGLNHFGLQAAMLTLSGKAFRGGCENTASRVNSGPQHGKGSTQ